jgi:hypothetical protein
MTTLAQSLRYINKPWQWLGIAAGILVVWIFVTSITLKRATMTDIRAHDTGISDFYLKNAAPMAAESPRAQSEFQTAPPASAGVERKIIRNSSVEMIVQHPAEVAEKISVLAVDLGGYLETSNSGGQDATSGSLAIRVPANQFEKARAEIRKLGLRVENEKVAAEDVTRQYVDQDARIRNLRAEEAGFLFILKQATTVKDMLAVSEKLSEVRGEIERQQAEFNALSKQIETVSMAISLRTESEAQVAGLNWRPGYQIKQALHDGLESIATYATTMIAVLFYLPATLLWAGTILGGVIVTRWILLWGKRWFVAKTVPEAKA